MANPKFKMVEQSCIDCGKKYESRLFVILETERSFDGGRCPGCRAAFIDKTEAAEKAAIEREYNRTRIQFRGSSGIPVQFLNKGFDQFQRERQKLPYDICLKYANGFPISNPQGYESMVLFSKKSWGCGKTHLAAAICHRIITRWNGEKCGCPVYFISEPDLFLNIQATYSYNDEERVRLDSEQDIIRKCIGVKLLVLDDVGKEERGDMTFIQRILFAIINGRYNARLPIVITANLDVDEMRVHMGAGKGNEAAFDRLREMTSQFVKMGGPSYREKS